VKPTVGDIVHYTNLGDRDGRFPPEIQAAIITAVKPSVLGRRSDFEEDCWIVSIHIFYRTGQFDMDAVPYAGEHRAGKDDARGKWQWPSKEDG